MQRAPNAMSDQFAYHRKAMRLRVGLDSRADITQPFVRARLIDAQFHTFVCYIHQELGLLAQLADRISNAGIAHPALVQYPDIDPNDIAFAQLLLAVGDTMANHVIHRGADCRRERRHCWLSSTRRTRAIPFIYRFSTPSQQKILPNLIQFRSPRSPY